MDSRGFSASPRVKARKFRIGDRLDVAVHTKPSNSAVVLSDDDISNLGEFELLVEEATEILTRETEAILSGDFNIISELFERKTTVMKLIELRSPLIQPFLNSKHVRSGNLAAKLNALTQAAQIDGALLERMASAAGTIVREIERASERHSLKGLYGNSGQKVGNTPIERLKIDKCL